VRIVASYPSRGKQPHDSKFYITASVFAPDGTIEITYSKTHPWAASTFENQHFALGHAFADSISLHPFPEHVHPDGRRPTPRPDQGDFSDVWLNVLICWDIEFPEPARIVRLSTPGTHHNSPLIIAIPTANADGDVAAFTLRARATENHCFILYANQAGSGFCGGSSVVGPDGQVLGTIDGIEEGMVVVDLDVGHERYKSTRTMNPMLEWRRPELYGKIGEEERWEKPSWHEGKVIA
jgi:predicted amidohydrolase